jgi:hypothetical protein
MLTIKKIMWLAMASFTFSAFVGTALAGEWNPNKGDLPAKENGQSLCLFNGLDEPDTSEDHSGGDPDDAFWADMPAAANSGGAAVVQSGGQIVAFFGAAAAGSQGTDCNPTRSGGEP